MDATNSLKPMGVQSKETMDVAAAKVKDAVDSTHSSLNRTVDQLADQVDDAKDGASEAIDKASGLVDVVAGKAREQLDAVKSQVGDRVATISDQIADYTEAEPLRAMLIAAATGAVLGPVADPYLRPLARQHY